jgi:glycosyltransferase involved in cell wall biosynthesis
MPLQRLAIDASRALVTPRTGTEWYSLEIVTALAALHTRPALRLYVRQGQDPALLPLGATVRPISMPRLWTHVGLSLATARERPEALFIPAHVVPAHHPRATVVTIHDLGYRVEPQAHPRRSRLLLDLSTRWSVRSARRVIAVSRQTRDDLMRIYGTAKEKIAVVQSGVNGERFHPLNAADVDARLTAAGIERPYLLFMSTVQPRKNLTRLVEAFESLNHPNMRLVIAGRTGWLADNIERRIAESPHRDRIIRLGYVDDSLAPALYCGAEAFVLPSLYEGFGMGVLEAMACGCPVVSSNVSSLPEVAGDAAVLVDPHDAGVIRDGIVRALQPDNRRHLIQRGFARAATFSWDRTARETLQVIESAHRASQK